MDEADNRWLMTMTGVSGWMFLLVPAHPGSPRQNPESHKMVVCACVCVRMCMRACMRGYVCVMFSLPSYFCSRSFIGSDARPVITTLHWHSLDVRCLTFSTEGSWLLHLWIYWAKLLKDEFLEPSYCLCSSHYIRFSVIQSTVSAH